MHPILFKIGPICIYSYGVMMVAAFFAATYLAARAAKRTGIPRDFIIDSAILMLFSGILGARILYVILDFKEYIRNPIEIIMVNHGGLAFYGGAVTALIAELIFIKVRGFSIYKIGDLLVPYIALGQAIGRIGCFLNGCCFGRPTDSFFGVIFPGTYQAVYPTQIYSSLMMLFVYMILRLLQKMNIKQGLVLISYGLLYSAGRFLMEFFRGDNMADLFGLTFSQFAGLVVFIVCAVLFFIRLKHPDGKTNY